MMRGVLLLLLLIGARREETGQVLVKVVPPPGAEAVQGRIEVYDLRDVYVWAQYRSEVKSPVPADPPEKTRIASETFREDETYLFALPAGTYYFKVTFPRVPARWFVSPPLKQNDYVEVAASFLEAGSIRGSWVLDKGAVPLKGKAEEPKGSAAEVHLVRQGLVFGAVKAKMNEAFVFSNVPPGEYDIVVSSVEDAFTWVVRQVKVVSGQETKSEVEAKRNSLGGVLFELKEKKSETWVGVTSRDLFLLMDPERSFVSRSTVNVTDRERQYEASGFRDLPAKGRYTLLYRSPGIKPCIKTGILLSSVKTRTNPRTRTMEFVYRKVTVDVEEETF